MMAEGLATELLLERGLTKCFWLISPGCAVLVETRLKVVSYFDLTSIRTHENNVSKKVNLGLIYCCSFDCLLPPQGNLF